MTDPKEDMARRAEETVLVAYRESDGMQRVAVHIFPHPQGVVFTDVGWVEASFHPHHLIKGEVRPIGADAWAVGPDWVIRKIQDGDRDGVWQDAFRWARYRCSEEGLPFDRDRCWRGLQDDVFYSDADRE